MKPNWVIVYVAQPPPYFNTYLEKELNCTLGFPCDNLLITHAPDFGPATKLLGNLHQFPYMHPDTCLITVDDDTIYGPHLVRTLVSRAPYDSALGLSCEQVPWILPLVQNLIPDALWWTSISSGLSWLYPLHDTIQCDGWLHGFQGVLYRKKFFASDVWNMSGMPKGCFYADDVRLSGYLWSKGIKRYVYPHYFADDGWNAPYVHLEKNASNALSLVPNTMKKRQWPCVQHFNNFY